MGKRTLFLLFLSSQLCAQSFYYGADFSYVNEMEACGVTYTEDQVEKDPYAIFQDHGCNLIRLRLWHTPSWYDGLNSGERFSDLADVKLSIARAKEENLNVLLDFQLSDNWADPSRQAVPAAWLSVVDDLDALQDSLYNYIFETLSELKEENLLPELIQIGNETNKGILLSPQDDVVWTLDWTRNAILFQRAIDAVRDFEQQENEEVKIVIHIAGPTNADWLLDGFTDNGVTDFDIIGLSYYWAWHNPTSIANVGTIIETLKNEYPNKEVLIVETGYIWTTGWNDNASNIINETHPDYQPVSPENQKIWLIDFAQEVIDAGGLGVIYWEPCWVSSTCFTQWGQGSHQEHATFFDFNNELLIPGGIEWMTYQYDFGVATNDLQNSDQIHILANGFSGNIQIKQDGDILEVLRYRVTDITGKRLLSATFNDHETSFTLQHLPRGMYIVLVEQKNKIVETKKIILEK